MNGQHQQPGAVEALARQEDERRREEISHSARGTYPLSARLQRFMQLGVSDEGRGIPDWCVQRDIEADVIGCVHEGPTEEPAAVPPAAATISYTSQSGEHIRAERLAELVEYLREDAESIRRDMGKKPVRTIMDYATGILETVDMIAPNLEACPPQLPTEKEVRDAEALLRRARGEARLVVDMEAARQRKALVSKEAFIMPSRLLADILKAVHPDAMDLSADYEAAEEAITRYGWSVDHVDNPAYIAKHGDPFRKLRDLVESCPYHHLTNQVLEIIELAGAWAKGTALNYGSGKAPEGVKYPFIRVELLPFAGQHGVLPKEYCERKSAVVEAEQQGDAA